VSQFLPLLEQVVNSDKQCKGIGEYRPVTVTSLYVMEMTKVTKGDMDMLS